jgi:hypothetical protein
MTPAFTVKPLLQQGALVASANSEVLVLQFIAESAFKLLLVVPLVAAAFLATLLVSGSALPSGGDISCWSPCTPSSPWCTSSRCTPVMTR